MPTWLPYEVPPTAGLPPRISDLLPRGAKLSNWLAEHLNMPPPQVTCSGSAALWLALRTLNEINPERSVVIVPAFTCPLVAIAVKQAGLKIKLCDVGKNHFELDLDALKACCDEQTLAIVATHLGGRVARLEEVVNLAEATGARVIEDAAQALGARQASASVGLQGDIGFFSLAVGKGLTMYEGGLLVSKHSDLRLALTDAAGRLISPNFLCEMRRCIEMLGYTLMYRPSLLSWVYGRPMRRALRQSDAIAAVGDRFPMQLPLHSTGQWRQQVAANAAPRLVDWWSATTRQATERARRLRALPAVSVLDDQPNQHGTWPFLIVLLTDHTLRDQVLERLWSSRLGVSRLYIHALADYDYLADLFVSANTPNARDFADRSLIISNSLWLTDDHFETIYEVIASVAG